MRMFVKLAAYARLMRLHRPIGVWLVFFPAAWGVVLALPPSAGADPVFLLGVLCKMLVGAGLIRSAGCILNDLADRRLDGAVARTATRPLVTGAVTVREALALTGLLLLLGLALVLTLPRTVFWLALLAVPMIVAYPFMKRITWWPQAFLGLTFNLGAPMGWAATGASLQLGTLWLYLACVFWTLGYDTLYALQDKDDDARIGIKSTARHFGLRVRAYVAAFYALAALGWLACLAATEVGAWAYAGWAVASLHLAWQVQQLRPPLRTERGGSWFASNQWVGVSLLLGLGMPSVL